MSYMTIGRLAKEAGVNIQTVRFYERRGLIPAPRRTPSGYREYSRDALSRLLFIRGAKHLGFTLREISELLSLRVDDRTPCEKVREKARAKIKEIDRRISSLVTIRKALESLVEACEGQGPQGPCPILEAMDGIPSAEGRGTLNPSRQSQCT
jgi:MerR family copper efflux transcriptional regulator